MRKLNRRALLGGASLAAFTASLPKTAWAGNPWAPTELGVELMRRLWGFAEATYVRVRTVDAEWSPEYDEAKVAAADEAENETEALIEEMVEAILKRPVTAPAHLTDLAIAEQVYDDPHSDSDRCREVTTALVTAILRLSGVPQNVSSMDAVYKRVARAHEAAEGHVA
jgi:hypothetical protein